MVVEGCGRDILRRDERWVCWREEIMVAVVVVVAGTGSRREDVRILPPRIRKPPPAGEVVADSW